MAAVKRAVIFDCDGVIFDSVGLHQQCWRTVLGKQGVKLTPELFAKVVGLSSIESAELIKRECDIAATAKELADAKDTLFAEDASELPAMPGALEALRRLKEEYAIGIATIRHRDAVEAALQGLGVVELADTVVAVEDLKPGQQTEELFELAAKQLEIPVGRCVVVEDARQGLLAAKRAGMKAVAFDSNPSLKLDYSMADAQINSLDELQPELINQVAAS